MLHTASPFIVQVEDPQRDLIDPAVKGTLNVLNECVKLRESQSNDDEKRLKRIVLTSSIAAVVDTAEENKIYDESDWNELSSLDKNPYCFSKVSAEKAAWKYMKEQEEKHGIDFLELVAINPGLVMGQPIMSKQVNQSHETLIKIANGEFPVIFAMEFALVDVLDVALAHINAMELEANNRQRFLPSKGERFIVCQETISMADICATLIDIYSQSAPKWLKKVPSTKMTGGFGNMIAKVATALTQSKGVRQYVNSTIGKPQYFNNNKVTTILGVKFRTSREIIQTSMDYLVSIGQIKN